MTMAMDFSKALWDPEKCFAARSFSACNMGGELQMGVLRARKMCGFLAKAVREQTEIFDIDPMIHSVYIVESAVRSDLLQAAFELIRTSDSKCLPTKHSVHLRFLNLCIDL